MKANNIFKILGTGRSGQRNSSSKGGMNLKPKVKTKLSRKQIVLLSTSILFLAISGVVFFVNMFDATKVLAAATGDYRSVATGNWNQIATWERYNGAAWVAAVATPTSADGTITLQSPYTVTVTANVTADQMVVDAGGFLIINSGKTLNVGNGAGSDMQVNGTVTINGTLTNQNSSTLTLAGTVTLKNGGTHNFASGAKITINNGGIYDRQDNSATTSANIWTVNSGGTYIHNIDGAAIVDATWNTGSTCKLQGLVSTKPSNLNKAFYNFIYDCAGQTGVINLTGQLDDIANDLTIVSTGSSSLRLGQPENYNIIIGNDLNIQGGITTMSAKSLSCLIDIGGDLNISGGIFRGSDATINSGEASPQVDIQGDFIMSNGTLDLNQHTAASASKGHTAINLYGNFNQSGGTITETATNNGDGTFNFAKAGTQTYVKSSGTQVNTVNWVINSTSITDASTYSFEGDGDFTLSSGAGIISAHANGIKTAAANGTVKSTGTRTFNTGADYTFNASAPQVTGNGVPSQVHDLTISNASGVTISKSISVSNNLNLSSGNVTASGVDTLTLGISTGTRGTLNRTSGQVIGNFKRWFNAAISSNKEFPLGVSTYYQGVNLSYTVAPTTGGTIIMSYSSTNPGVSGLPLIEAGDTISNIGYGLWSATTGNGMSGGTFSLDITATALPSVADYTKLHLLRRANGASPWTLQGSHSAGTGSNAVPVVHRSGMTSQAHFGVGGSSANPLPIALTYFKAKLNKEIVKLSWATASEVNNDFFTVERSRNGTDFEELLRVPGAGNSTTTRSYEGEDPSPFTDYTYYRLKQTDYDGHYSYSEIVPVLNTNKIDQDQMKITSMTPNPFSDRFSLNFTTNKVSTVEFLLVSVNGQVIARENIQSQSGENTFEFLNRYDLKNGIYFVYLVSGDQRVSRRVIKGE